MWWSLHISWENRFSGTTTWTKCIHCTFIFATLNIIKCYNNIYIQCYDIIFCEMSETKDFPMWDVLFCTTNCPKLKGKITTMHVVLCGPGWISVFMAYVCAKKKTTTEWKLMNSLNRFLAGIFALFSLSLSLSLSLSVCVCVCVCVCLQKKILADFHETWWNGEAWAKEDFINFTHRSKSQGRYTNYSFIELFFYLI